MTDAALVLPPHWYFLAVPGDITVPLSWLRAKGWDVAGYDLSLETRHALFGDLPTAAVFRAPAALAMPVALAAAEAELAERADVLSRAFHVDVSDTHLSVEGMDTGHVPAALRWGLDPFRNPALGVLKRTAEKLVRANPRLIGLALVHPEHIHHVPTLARLLRDAGYSGTIAVFGTLEDVVAPADLLPLADDHVLWDLVDVVIVYEPEEALEALLEAGLSAAHPHLVRPRQPPGRRTPVDLARHPTHDPTWIVAAHHPYPWPLPDLRLGRGCPWGRCAFCAIQAHHPEVRRGKADALARDAAA